MLFFKCRDSIAPWSSNHRTMRTLPWGATLDSQRLDSDEQARRLAFRAAKWSAVDFSVWPRSIANSLLDTPVRTASWKTVLITRHCGRDQHDQRVTIEEALAAAP